MHKKLLLGIVLMFLLVPSAFAILTDAHLYYSYDNDNLSGSNPVDITLYGNDGTNNGATTGVSGKLSEAFDFDGTNDYIAVPTSLFDQGKTFTFCTWSESDLASTDQTIFDFRGNGVLTYMILADGGTSNEIEVYIRDTADGANRIETTAYTITNNLHICYTVDSGAKQMELFVNGASVATETWAGSITDLSQSSNSIGQNSALAEFYNGVLDETGIWYRVLTDTEISDLYNSGSGNNPIDGADSLLLTNLVYYSFDDANITGSNPDDISLNGNDGTNNGATTGATGQLDEAFDFDGTNDYLTFSTRTIASTEARSVAGWIYLDTVTGDDYIHYSDTSGSLALFKVSSTSGNFEYYDGGAWRDTGQAYATGAWHHVAYTVDSAGTGFEFYYDGTSVHTGTYSAVSFGGSMALGSNTAGTSSYLDGKYDEFAVYNRELTSGEVSDLYNSGAGLNPYTAVPPSVVSADEYPEQSVEVTQIGTVGVSGTTFVPIVSGSFELLNITNVSTDFAVNVLKNSGGTTGTVECRIETNGNYGNSAKNRTVTKDQYGSLYVMTEEIELNPGNYTSQLECRRTSGTGQIQISGAEGLISVLTKTNGEEIFSQSNSFDVNISSSSYTLLDAFNITTSDRNVTGTLEKKIILKSFLEYDYASTGVIDVYFAINGTKQGEMPRYGAAGSTGSVGYFAEEAFTYNGSENIEIQLYGKSSTSDGSVSGVTIAKEFILTENETKQVNLNNTALSSATYVNLTSVAIENNGKTQGAVVVKAAIPYEATSGAATTTFRIVLDSTLGSTMTRDVSAANQEGVAIIQDQFPVGSGNYTVYLQGLTDSAVNIVGGDMLVYVGTDLAFEQTAFNVTVNNTWDGSTLTNFNVLTGAGGNFSDGGAGFVTIPYESGETTINLTIAKDNYLNRTYLNHATSGDLVASIYQTEVSVNVTELLSNNPVNTFTLETQSIVPTYSTTNGTVNINPNFGNYSWNVTAAGYFDLDQNAVEITGSGAITIENISSTIINITAVSALNGSSINTFTIDIDSLDFDYSRTQNTTNGFVELAAVDGDYNVTINATGYAIGNAIVTVDNQTVTAYEFQLYTPESLNIYIYDEVTNTLLNGTNITVQIVGADNNTYTTTNATLYVDFLTPSDYELRYFSTANDDYKLRSTFVSVTAQSTENINLYLLNTSDTDITTATITFKVFDEDLDAVEDAIVIVSRYYPENNTYLDVWSRKTNDQGRAVGIFETIDAFYRYRVVYDDLVKYQSSVSGVQFSADEEIDIFIDLQTSLYDLFEDIGEVSVSDISWNVVSNTSAYYQVTFSAGSSVTVCLSATAVGYLAQSVYGDTLTNTTCATSTGGTLIVYVVGSNSGQITYNALVTVKTSDLIGFIPVKQRTDTLGGVSTPTGSDWTYNMSWLAILITMLSALIYIKKYPRTALLFQAVAFLAITASPIPFIPTPVSYAVVFICLVLFILMKKGGQD